MEYSGDQRINHSLIGPDNLVATNQWMNGTPISSSQLTVLNPLPSLSPSCIDNFFNLNTDQHLLSVETTQNQSKLNPIEHFSSLIDQYYNLNHPTYQINENFPDSTTSITNIENGTIEVRTSSVSSENNDSNDSSSSPDDQSGSKFKKKLSINKDCSKVKEPWIPNVAKKLLTVDYSPLYIKSELITNQLSLDIFESVALQEAVQAFNEIAFISPRCDSDTIKAIESDFYSDPRPIELVLTCKKVRSIRKLHLHDKMILMANAFFYINAIKSVITFDEKIDGWNFAGQIWPRKFFLDALAEVEDIIETFPDCLRNNLNIATLLYLIVIFNPDLPKLKYRNSIRNEQYIYIYLLKRYLISLFGATCEAADYHYRLMVKIEQILNSRHTKVFEKTFLGSSKILRNRVVNFVKEMLVQNSSYGHCDSNLTISSTKSGLSGV